MLPKFKFRASSIGKIMSDAQSIDPALMDEKTAAISRKTKKTDEDKALLAPLKEKSLSVGAKTYCEQIAKEFVYGFEEEVTSKYMEKGLIVEDQSIALYNEVFFTSHVKNVDRRENEWVTGECDIFTGRKIIDIKSAWSLATFPATAATAYDADYEWQVRTYMWLWEADVAEVAHCLVNTPDELIGYEQAELHFVDHIEPTLRVTRVQFTRDMALEAKMRRKVESATAYVNKMVEQIIADHQG
ncbi:MULTISPECIES: hypothetical protein [unclassified Achromobacter]|uniref:hypothetical protein n=1 Tax=unclassified Achromobacter TaxID=2626865 RepID=UPI000B519F7B|nr:MULTISPECIES: hypothetical protein [unclassified Achromobacter]OWT68059.1 hypothetical protein CEY05_28920 [Achromobacter sp. HZ34]OWT69896.1 hypothetical protein CEY04_27750 [Achromobacter sp. HZ28]